MVVEAFINNIVKVHGFPKSIVSVRDRVFISSFWQQLFKSQGIILSMSSSYHSQSDGQTENLNKTLEIYLYLNIQKIGFQCFLGLNFGTTLFFIKVWE